MCFLLLLFMHPTCGFTYISARQFILLIYGAKSVVHKITAQFGLEGTSKLTQILAMDRDTSHQTTLPRTPSSLSLSTSRDGPSPPLGSLYQCLPTLTLKNFFPMFDLHLHSFSLQFSLQYQYTSGCACVLTCS